MSKQTPPKFVSKARLVDRAAEHAGAVPLARRFVLVWQFGLKKLILPRKHLPGDAASTTMASTITPRRTTR